MNFSNVESDSQMDWIIHAVWEFGPEGTSNNHTHGMEKYDHLDFQLVLHVAPKLIGYLLNSMGMRVLAGERFAQGDMVKGLFDDCDVRLDLHRETGRDVLRLIIPDGKNRFPEDPLCKAPYKYQTRKMFY